MPAPIQPAPKGKGFFPIRFAECRKCGAVYAYCALELLSTHIEKSTHGMCQGCLFGDSMAGIATLKITSRMNHELAIELGGACG